MQAIRHRFFYVTAIAVAICSIVLYATLNLYLFSQEEVELLAYARIVDVTIQEDGNNDTEALLSRIKGQMDNDTLRITVIQTDGEVLADSDVTDADAMDNHLARKEVQEALKNTTGSSLRYSDTLKRTMLYVAYYNADQAYVVRVSIAYQGLQGMLAPLFFFLGIGVSLSLLTAYGLSRRFAGTVAAPMEEIAREMDHADGKNPSFHFREYQYRELNVISQTSADMANRINAYLEEVENQKRVKQEFFSNASHELKTPITSIHGYAELLYNGFASDEETRRDFVHRILMESEHMTSLINDILEISRLESREHWMSAGKVPVDLREIALEVQDALKPLADSRQVKLRCYAEPVFLEARPEGMRELISNLVSNGIKYNKPGGYVETTIHQVPGGITLRVEDSGIGIPEKAKAHIFERFYRVDAGRSRKNGGTGLGLSIVKHLVSHYNGTVQVDSELGKGSVFTVFLPFPSGKVEVKRTLMEAEMLHPEQT